MAAAALLVLAAPALAGGARAPGVTAASTPPGVPGLPTVPLPSGHSAPSTTTPPSRSSSTTSSTTSTTSTTIPPGSATEPAGAPPDTSAAPSIPTIGKVLALSVLGGGMPASPIAEAEIPPVMLVLYQRSATACPGLPWTVLAGVGGVESDHGRRATHSPVTGASGPMGLLPAVWARYATDANHDGTASVDDPADAVAAAAAALCADGAGAPGNLSAALHGYNDADWFAVAVLADVARYAQLPTLADAPTVGAYALPVNPLILAADPSLMSRPHHDFAAWDLPVPVGTAVYAVTSGTVVPSNGTCGAGLLLYGTDGFTYQYCHGSQVLVTPGARVGAGQLIMLSGNTGASTGPHLHFGIMRNGVNYCPQPIIQAWYEGIGLSPMGAPTTGCFYAS